MSRETFFWKKWKVYIITLLIIFFSISAYQQSKSFYLGLLELDRPFQIMAHRGGSDGIENSRESIQTSINQNVSIVEIDVRVTRDKIPVVFHDETIKYNDNGQRIRDLLYSDVILIDQFPETEQIDSVAILSDIIQEFGDKIQFNIEIKTDGGIPNEDIDAILEVIDDRLLSAPIISSLDYSVIKRVRDVRPELETGFIIAAGVGDISIYDADWLIVNNTFYKSFRDIFLTDDRKIILWSFSPSWDGFEAYALGVDGAIVNHHGVLQGAIDDLLAQSIYKRSQTVLKWVWDAR